MSLVEPWAAFAFDGATAQVVSVLSSDGVTNTNALEVVKPATAWQPWAGVRLVVRRLATWLGSDCTDHDAGLLGSGLE